MITYLGGRLNENLPLATLLGVDDGVEAVTENGDLHHGLIYPR